MTDTTTQLRPHTLKSIAADADTQKRTVQRWLEKAVRERGEDIGEIRDSTRYFTDAERDILLSYQTTRKPQPEEIIEAELVEPGAIALRTDTQTAAPLVQFNLEPVELALPTTDFQAMQAQTEQLQANAQQGANAINAYFAARMDVGLAQIAAEQDNLLQGIRASALNGAAASVARQNA